MEKQKIQFKILTPQHSVYENEVDEISIPTKEGRVKVYARHVGMVSLVDSGEIIVVKDDEEIVLHVHKGILEVKPGSIVNVLADSADHIHELDEEKINIARKRAQKAMENLDNKDDIAFARFEDQLIRELSRLEALKKYRQ